MKEKFHFNYPDSFGRDILYLGVRVTLLNSTNSLISEVVDFVKFDV